MSRTKLFVLTMLAMIAFAGNSLLCRQALKHTSIDPASFTLIRIAAGAFVLWLIVLLRDGASKTTGNWPSAFALFLYAAAFSYSYVSLPAAAGALMLFGAVQATMISYGVWAGDRLGARKTLGLLLACGGLVGLLLPGLSSPPLTGSVLMLASGIAWGIYSLRGKSGGDPIRNTAGNFLKAALFAVSLSLGMFPWINLDPAGVGYALASGAFTSGLGYAVWYTVLRGLQPSSAAVVQLSVPVIAALGGAIFLSEPLSQRLVICSVAVLGGVTLVTLNSRRVKP